MEVRMNLETVKEQLREELARIEAREARLQRHLRSSPSPGPADWIDVSGLHTDDPVVERLEDSARARIIALRGAIERIEHNRFGRCEYCLDPIAPERLLAIPYTRVCARCAP